MSGLLSPQQFPDDDGSAAPGLRTALAGGEVREVVAALAGTRVLVPVVAVLGESGESSLTGLATDKSADMALVTLTAPDGRQVLPVFSSTDALLAWDARARPVPVLSRRAALSAVDEGCELIVVDPAGAGVLVPRPAVWALAQDAAWVPSPEHPEVLAAVAALEPAEPALVAARCESGRRAELAVVLALRPGLTREQVDALTARVGEALAASPAVADHVDSLELRVVPA